MIRQALDRLFRRRSPEGDIFVFTMPRSGMTWLMEMFDTLPCTRCVQEPMTSAWIPLMSRYFTARRRYAGVSPDELDGIVSYLSDILENRIRRTGYNFLRGRKFMTRLNVLALARASVLATVLEERLRIRPMVFLRHPVSSSLSRMRNRWHLKPRFGAVGWGQFIDVYLEDSEYTKRMLAGNGLDTCWRVRRDGTDLERYVLSWCLDALPLLKALESRPWLLVCYEDLVTDPGRVVSQLGSHFRITGTERMLSRVRRPSGSSHLSTGDAVEAIRSGQDDGFLLGRWREQVPTDLAEACFRILSDLGISLYSLDSDLPSPSSLPLRTSRVSS